MQSVHPTGKYYTKHDVLLFLETQCILFYNDGLKTPWVLIYNVYNFHRSVSVLCYDVSVSRLLWVLAVSYHVLKTSVMMCQSVVCCESWQCRITSQRPLLWCVSQSSDVSPGSVVSRLKDLCYDVSVSRLLWVLAVSYRVSKTSVMMCQSVACCESWQCRITSQRPLLWYVTQSPVVSPGNVVSRLRLNLCYDVSVNRLLWVLAVSYHVSD